MLEYPRHWRGLPGRDDAGTVDLDDGRGVDRPGHADLDLSGRTADDNVAPARRAGLHRHRVDADRG